jgi:hypothetical protein
VLLHHPIEPGIDPLEPLERGSFWKEGEGKWRVPVGGVGSMLRGQDRGGGKGGEGEERDVEGRRGGGGGGGRGGGEGTEEGQGSGTVVCGVGEDGAGLREGRRGGKGGLTREEGEPVAAALSMA